MPHLAWFFPGHHFSLPLSGQMPYSRGGKQKTTQTKSDSGGCVSLIKMFSILKNLRALWSTIFILRDNSQGRFMSGGPRMKFIRCRRLFCYNPRKFCDAPFAAEQTKGG